MVAHERLENYITFVIEDQKAMCANRDEDRDYRNYLCAIDNYDDIEDWLFCYFGAENLNELDFEKITDDRLYTATVDALCIGMLESLGVDSGSAIVDFEKKYHDDNWER